MKMHPRLIATVATCLFLASVSAARAQEERLRAHVPFAFTVGQTTLPGGTYEVSRLNAQSNVLLVRGDIHSVILRVDRADGGAPDDTTRLEFHRYADQYFLRGVVFERTLDLSVPETAGERLAAERRQGRFTAGVETVAVLAQRQ